MRQSARRLMAWPPRQDPEERLDIRVRAHVPIIIEVRSAAHCTAVPRQAREERLDVRVGPDVLITIEVRAVHPHEDARAYPDPAGVGERSFVRARIPRLDID